MAAQDSRGKKSDTVMATRTGEQWQSGHKVSGGSVRSVKDVSSHLGYIDLIYRHERVRYMRPVRDVRPVYYIRRLHPTEPCTPTLTLHPLQ